MAVVLLHDAEERLLGQLFLRVVSGGGGSGVATTATGAGSSCICGDGSGMGFSSCLADARVLDCANLSEHLSSRTIFCVCGYFGVRSSASARHAVKTCTRHGALALAAPSPSLKKHAFTIEALASIAVLRNLLPCILGAFNACNERYSHAVPLFGLQLQAFFKLFLSMPRFQR